MNTGEQRELRQWADQLCEVDDPERRAMGRAIAMLLDRIDELERELSAVPQEILNGDPDRNGEPAWDEQPDVVAPRASLAEPISIGEDTQQLSLRDRLRHAADNLRDRGER
ncbi:MAG: hypothetical protein ACJ738_05285 [Gaiellales bacterium]|jgi:hypothetical protein|nr:hypothetical protein [Gaiellales bacterium]